MGLEIVARYRFKIFAVLFTVISLSLGQEQYDFEISPSNVTAYQDQWAEFTCVITDGFLSWAVNGKPHHEFPPNDIGTLTRTDEDGPVLNVLKIRTRSEYNETTIQCLINSGFSGVSDIVTLTIQGKPSPLGDLNTTYSTSTVTISWTAPFSLDVTGVDHDIWYSVIIYNVTDENNPTVMDCTDCINITDTHYTFTPSPCTIYNTSVIPINGAGLGNTSDNITIYPLDGVIFILSDMKVLNDVFVTFEVCLYEVMNYMITGIPYKAVTNNTYPILRDIITYRLGENQKLSVILKATTIIEGVHIFNETISTYDIQSVEVEEIRDGLRVTAELMTDSRAAGFLVVLKPLSSLSPDIFRVTLRTGTENTLLSTLYLTSASYLVYAYDLEVSILPEPSPAVMLAQVSVTAGSGSVKKKSGLLKKGDIRKEGDTLLIDCELEETSPQYSCVLVYREYDSPLLAVIELPQVFPVSITVDNTENYTFALFGKDSLVGTIDEEPAVTVRFTDSGLDDDTQKDSVEEEIETTHHQETDTSQTEIVAIATSTGVIGVLTGGVVVLLIVLMRWYYNIRKSRNTGPTGVVNRGVEYEEVDLPQTNTSSSPVIVTEPNTAYATTSVSNNV